MDKLTIKTNNTRQLIPYGYKSFTGQTFSDDQVDSYNFIQRRINAFVEAGAPVPEYLISGSHNLFTCYSRAF